MNLKRLCVIIVTYNGAKWINNCLNSVLHSTVKTSIIVIDNNSTDETTSFIKKISPQIILLEQKENKGFGLANNIGLKYAIEHNYEYIYLLNQDAWVESNTLQILIDILDNNINYGIVSPLQLSGDGNKLDYNFQTLLSPHICKDLLSDLVVGKETKDIYPTNDVMAAHWMIRTESLKKVGGFMPLFQHYGEDGNLIHRMKYFGWEVGISPNCIGYHDREYRINSSEKNLYLVYVQFLISSSDITLSPKRILYFICKLIVLVTITKGSIARKGFYLYKGVGKVLSILNYRKLAKQSALENFKWIL